MDAETQKHIDLYKEHLKKESDQLLLEKDQQYEDCLRDLYTGQHYTVSNLEKRLKKLKSLERRRQEIVTSMRTLGMLETLVQDIKPMQEEEA